MLVEAAEIYARIDSMGDVGAIVAQGKPQEVMDFIQRWIFRSSSTTTLTRLM